MDATSALIPEWHADFMTDWRDNMAKLLDAMGYSIPASDDVETVFLKLRSVERRRPSVKKRKVFISKEFNCPAEHQGGLDEIKRKVQEGEDIFPHLSKGIFEASYEDALLNDWGLLHFHLGLNPHNKEPRLVERTGPVLFAVVTDTGFYMIDVKGHGSWANKDLVEIVHTNWPNLFAHAKAHDVLGLEQEINEQERLQLRSGELPQDKKKQKQPKKQNEPKFAINAFFTVSDGTVYTPTGMGVTASGHNILDVQLFLQNRKMINDLDKKVTEQLPEIMQLSTKHGKQLNAPLRIRFNHLERGLPCITVIGSDCTEMQFLLD